MVYFCKMKIYSCFNKYRNPQYFFRLLSLIILCSLSAQLNAQNRCKKCNIGFDGELITDTLVNGAGLGTGIGTDDWFNGPVSGPGNFPIDTTLASKILADYLGGANYSFSRAGRYAPFHKQNGKTWIWAAYLRDNVAGSGTNDSSCFISANKN